MTSPIDLAELDHASHVLLIGWDNPHTEKLARAYPALRRVVEALGALVKCDEGYPGLLDDQYDGYHNDTVTGQTSELKTALAQAREALSAFKLPEAG